MSRKTSHTPPRAAQPKQPYRKPRLTVYGDLTKITTKGGTLADGIGKPRTRK